MRQIFTALAIASILSVSSPVWAAQGDHLVISNLKVPARTQLQAGVPYEASIDIRTPGEAVELKQLCFFWNSDGPYCFKQWEMRRRADGSVSPTIGLYTGNPGKYRLTAVAVYSVNGKSYETNQTSVEITVR